MSHTDPWIWLPRALYPDAQTSVFSAHGDMTGARFAVAEFVREYDFGQPVERAHLRFSGDTAFVLYLNGEPIATGPACVGGDFIGNETPRDTFYAFERDVQPRAGRLSFRAVVRMTPAQLCEYSQGHGGFLLTGEAALEDGTRRAFQTGEDWLCRLDRAWVSPEKYDGRAEQDAFVPAEPTEDIWHALAAPIPVRDEFELTPEGCELALAPADRVDRRLALDAIEAGFVRVTASAGARVRVSVTCRERGGDGGETFEATFASGGDARGMSLRSAGLLDVSAENMGVSPARVRVTFISTHYPVRDQVFTRLSDTDLQQVLDTCRHTLTICRQTHHLDSPKHCEPLACTGDYYIETLMTPFSLGDMALAKFDLLRTAVMLRRENGRMFHTTYSLIWVKMLWDTYMITGDRDLLETCEDALGLLLRRFETYLGENGLIESPPDYMFVDWIYIDGLSMHHPPKALGQTCLNMFYYAALEAASAIYGALGRRDEAGKCAASAEALRVSINALLYDPAEGAYFEGLNTPTDEALVGGWMPRNVAKRYTLKHSNILAAWSGVCDDQTGRRLIDAVMTDRIGGDIQPYFTHYLLEAVWRLGLREKWTVPIVRRWVGPVRDCPGGLSEGFIKPEPTYRFDHSHAWGGTPLWSLSRALMGLEILAPGMTKLRLSPSLLGLQWASVGLMTPHGEVKLELCAGEAPKVTHPPEVTVEMQSARAV